MQQYLEGQVMPCVCEPPRPTVEEKLKRARAKLKISNNKLASAVKAKAMARRKAKKTHKLLIEANKQLKEAQDEQLNCTRKLDFIKQEILPKLVNTHIKQMQDLRSKYKASADENRKLRVQIEDMRLENHEARQEIEDLNVEIKNMSRDIDEAMTNAETRELRLEDSLLRLKEGMLSMEVEISRLYNLLAKVERECNEVVENGRSEYLLEIAKLQKREAALGAEVEALSILFQETIAHNNNDDDINRDDEYDMVPESTRLERTKGDETGMWERLEVDDGSSLEFECDVMMATTMKTMKKKKPLLGKIGSLMWG